ncbi:MAG: hypothetical protein J6P56_03690, partial [Bacteroidales bacterium]|nr:hypothetical protein [Bacteroidales bacterium]
LFLGPGHYVLNQSAPAELFYKNFHTGFINKRAKILLFTELTQGVGVVTLEHLADRGVPATHAVLTARDLVRKTPKTHGFGEVRE